MPTFTPPTQRQGVRRGDPLFDRYTVPVGLSVVKVNGTFTTQPYPWLGDLEGLTEGVDYFLGGHGPYVISNEIATELEVAGFAPVTPGYGEGAYGFGLYGG